MRWLKHNQSERAEEFDKIMEHVRLPLLTPYFLHDVVAKETVIVESQSCGLLLEEAKTYHLLLDRRMELRSPRSRPRKASGVYKWNETDIILFNRKLCLGANNHTT